jgi:hypothetical protein
MQLRIARERVPCAVLDPAFIASPPEWKIMSIFFANGSF